MSKKCDIDKIVKTLKAANQMEWVQKMNSIKLLELLREVEDSSEDMPEELRDGTTGNVFPNIRKQNIPRIRKH